MYVGGEFCEYGFCSVVVLGSGFILGEDGVFCWVVCERVGGDYWVDYCDLFVVCFFCFIIVVVVVVVLIIIVFVGFY